MKNFVLFCAVEWSCTHSYFVTKMNDEFDFQFFNKNFHISIIELIFAKILHERIDLFGKF